MKELKEYGDLCASRKFEGLDVDEVRKLVILELILDNKLKTLNKILLRPFPSHQMYQGEYISDIKKIINDHKEFLSQ